MVIRNLCSIKGCYEVVKGWNSICENHNDLIDNILKFNSKTEEVSNG